jgi:hypothetical protein
MGEDLKKLRLNTQLESEAAEFLVLANLLLNKVPSHKNYTRHKDYDIIATNPINNKLAKIQVKSRYRLNAWGFPINNFNSDFVVFCRLNRKMKEKQESKEPEFYIFPTKLVKQNTKLAGGWNKCMVSKIPSYEKYHMNWKLITSFLGY